VSAGGTVLQAGATMLHTPISCGM